MQSSPTTILLVRHAQTMWNREQRHTGSSEVAMSTEADKQIAILTKYLLGFNPQAVYSSPLTRCQITITPLAEILQLPIHTQAELKERHLGAWEGHTPTELLPTHPGYRYPFSAYNGDFRIPEAETLEEVQHRIRAILHLVAEAHPGQTTVLSTHSGIIWTVLHKIVTNPAEEDIWPPNCSVTTIVQDGNHWSLESFKNVLT